MNNTQDRIDVTIIDETNTATDIKENISFNPETFKSSNDRFNPNKTIYVRAMYGYFQRLRRWIGAAVFGFFVIIPWLSYHGKQAILLDFFNQQFRFYSLTLVPQDLVLLALFFIIAAYSLFFVTTFYGRVWCGYTCPQTVWTFLFIWFEEHLEGPANKRKSQNQKPLTRSLFIRKLIKHLCWLTISLITAISFIGFLVPIRELYHGIIHFELTTGETFWILFFTIATYGNAGWMRSIVCTHMCPYARFQSAMFDKDTFIVAYDSKRGEPRAPRSRKTEDHSKLGDCIDCDLCVQVCPSGIDIRDGLQYECINCGACIDACNQTMDRWGYAPNLISYTTEHQLTGKQTKLFRFKLVGYGLVLTIILSLFAYKLTHISPMGLEVVRDRGKTSRLNNEGRIENTYILKLQNKTQEKQKYEVSVKGLPHGAKWYGKHEIYVAPSSIGILPVSIAVLPDEFSETATHSIFFIMKDERSDKKISIESRFIH